MMIDLLTYPAAFGLFSTSPFCIKAAYLLNMSGVPWQREDTSDPRKMPFGKLPVIRVDGHLMADSDNIRHYLEKQGTDFDAGLSDLDKANARAIIRMAEEHLYFNLVLDRWGDDAIWPTVRNTYFGQIPAPLRGLIANRIRRDVVRGLHFQGVGRLPKLERMRRIETDIDSIVTHLWQGPFLFGQAPTGADASLAPVLAAISATPGTTALKSMVTENDVLSRYIARVDAQIG